MATSDQILSVFVQFCKECKAPFHQIGAGVFTSSFRGKVGKLEVKCYIGDTYLLFYSLLPVIVPPEKQQAVMEFITMVNFNRIISSFEMDLKNGDVALKTGINIVDGQMTPKMLSVLLRENIGIADHYLEGVCQIVFANLQPSVALSQLEQSEEEDAEDDETLRELLNDPDLDQVLGSGDD